MKAEFFVIAFCVLLTGAYVTYDRHRSSSGNESSIVISNGAFSEEINYAGKISFTDDGTAIKTISPGGFIKYKENDKLLEVVCNKQGEISYLLSDAGNKIPLDSNGQKFIAHAVKEWIAWGIDAGDRMELIYKNGGNRALINELENLKNDNVKRMYFDQLLKSDSLSKDELVILASKANKIFGSDEDKLQVLEKFSPAQLMDSATELAYLQSAEAFESDYSKSRALKSLLKCPSSMSGFNQLLDIIDRMNDENEKAGLLRYIIDKKSLNEEQYGQVLETLSSINDDMQEHSLLIQMIGKAAIPVNKFDTLLGLIGRLRDDQLKQDLYRKLISGNSVSGQQWIALIDHTADFGGDNEKSNYLLSISQKMPQNDSTKNAYRKVARCINDNGEYGKALRAIE